MEPASHKRPCTDPVESAFADNRGGSAEHKRPKLALLSPDTLMSDTINDPGKTDYEKHVVVLHADGLWRTELSFYEDAAQGTWCMSYRRRAYPFDESDSPAP